MCRYVDDENQPLCTEEIQTTGGSMKQCFDERVPVFYVLHHPHMGTRVMQYTCCTIPVTVGDGDNAPRKAAIQQEKVGHGTLNVNITVCFQENSTEYCLNF